MLPCRSIYFDVQKFPYLSKIYISAIFCFLNCLLPFDQQKHFCLTSVLFYSTKVHFCPQKIFVCPKQKKAFLTSPPPKKRKKKRKKRSTPLFFWTKNSPWFSDHIFDVSQIDSLICEGYIFKLSQEEFTATFIGILGIRSAK